MKHNDSTVWGIHAGRYSDADELFLNGSRIGLGWTKLGNLGELGSDRESFKRKVAEAYPDKKPGAIPNNAGQLFRFVHELKTGDIVAYPSKKDRQIHLGRVESGYLYDPERDSGYPHQRTVKWLKAVPRTRFSQGALYEIGSALSFFQIKSFADEYRHAIEASTPPIPEPSKDETVGVVADEIEETTRDFVLKRLAQELKGKPFEGFVAQLLRTMGYRTREAPEGTDGGIDIIAHRDELGFQPPIVKVQVKSTEDKVGDPVVSALYGKVSQGEYGLLVTLGVFTPNAIAFARSKSNLRLIDGDELVNLIFEHYEELDSRYKSLLPLRRVYVPEPIEDGE